MKFNEWTVGTIPIEGGLSNRVEAIIEMSDGSIQVIDYQNLSFAGISNPLLTELDVLRQESYDKWKKIQSIEDPFERMDKLKAFGRWVDSEWKSRILELVDNEISR